MARQAAPRSDCRNVAQRRLLGRNRSSRGRGLWRVKRLSHRQNPSPLPGPAHRSRGYRIRRAHRTNPASPRRNGRRWPHHPRKGSRHPLPPGEEIVLERGSLVPLFCRRTREHREVRPRTLNKERTTVNCFLRPEAAEKQSWLNRTVLGVGLTSLFSDWSHETATAVLPAFLAAIGAGPVWLGAIEGVADGLSSFAKLIAGHYTDRLKSRKPLAVFSYAFTPLCTASFGLAT